MAKIKTVTTSDLRKMRVLGGKKGTKRIGKVKYCVFHPSEKRCIGFLVKRPDLLWMFRRKDVFVAIDDFEFQDGRIVVNANAAMDGAVACKRMGIDWNRCVLWEGMPLMVDEQNTIGHVGNITFSLPTGEIQSVVANNGTTAKYILGTLEVPSDYIVGFRRGIGVDLSVGEEQAGTQEEKIFKGAIIVSDDVWQLQPEGGWAEAAGEFTAKAKARVQDTVSDVSDKVKPKVAAAAAVTGEAINMGAYATGKQIKASKGMFSAFKDEYEKARHDDSGIAPEDESYDADAPVKNMFTDFRDAFRDGRAGKPSEYDVPEDDDDDDEWEEEDAPEVDDDVNEVEDEYEDDDVDEVEDVDDDDADDVDDDDDAEPEDDDDDVDDEDDEYEDDDEEDDDEYEYEYEEPEPKKTVKKAAKPEPEPTVGGMFSAFKDAYKKARYDD